MYYVSRAVLRILLARSFANWSNERGEAGQLAEWLCAIARVDQRHLEGLDLNIDCQQERCCSE